MRIVLSLLCVGAFASVAQAQPSTSAETLFREGKALMTQGKIPEACAAFEGSYRKDPATSTLLNVADCREKNKQYATAWAAFVEVERRSRASGDAAQVAINTLAKERAAKLEPRISYLTISVPDEARVEGLVLTRDGEPIDTAEWNRALPADIGVHKIDAKAPAYESWSTTVTIVNEQEKAAITIPRFKPLPKVRTDKQVEVIDPSPFTAKRKLAIGLGGVGVIGAGVGVWLYVTAKGQYDDAKLEPDDVKQKDLWDSANQKYLIAQIAGGVAVASLGTAAFLWFTGKPAIVERPELAITPSIGPGGAGIVAIGSF